MNLVKKTIEGTGLLARALCHEIDHLHGILYIDKWLKKYFQKKRKNNLEVTKLNLVFAGTPEFALPTLEALYENGHNISLVITQKIDHEVEVKKT